MQISLGFKSLFFILIVNTGAIQGMGIIQVMPSLFTPVSGIISLLTPRSSSPSTQKAEKRRSHKLKRCKKNFEQVLNTLKDENLPKENSLFADKMHLSAVSMLLKQDYDHSYFNHHIRPIDLTVNRKPTNFLLCCYYQQYHEDWEKDDIKQLLQNKAILNKCKVTHAGYSPVGAAIAAQGISSENKREFIRQLIDNGFELTEKDRMLAADEFYDEVPEETKIKIISLWLGQGDLVILPEDVRNLIISNMIDIFKKATWLLPDFK